MSDTRTISDFRFGLEWSPKLAEMMLRFPWLDSAFVAGDPTKVCKVCGRGETTDVHVAVEPERGGELHVFEPSPPFSEEKIAAARDEWRRRMANLPTPEAESAWIGIHAEKTARLMALFLACDVKTREDIELLGCTGCVEHGLSLDDIKFLRIGLAGSGVGLPCFVPPDRYCLAHEVTGGLQDGQGQRFAHRVDDVARPLTAAEQAHDKLVQAARKSPKEYDTHSMLHGHTLPKGWEETMDGADGGAQVETFAQAVEGIREEGGIETVRLGAQTWKCDEHTKTDWACRHCVAQAVVEGELETMFVLGVISPADPIADPPREAGFLAMTSECPGSGIATEIAEEDRAGAASIKLYVRVATFTRKLARD